MTSDQELVFEAAAERWRTVIVGDLPDVNATGIAAGACGSGSPAVNETIDDLLIFVTLESIDGPLGILGSAAPCFIRSSTRFTLIGRIRIDLDDVPLLESRGILEAVIQHEFGHVIGIGPLWTQPPSLLSGSVASGGSDPYFTGAGAIQEFDAKGGALYAGQRVPVENVGGGGTADAHWREAVMGRELMTGFLSWTSNPLSSITIASLGDMGYSVSYTYADEYTVNPANLRLGGILDGFYLKEAVPDWSLKEIDRRGRTTTLSQYPSANH